MSLKSEFNGFLGFSNGMFFAFTNSIEKPTNVTNIDKIRLLCDCMDDSVIISKGESILSPFRFRAPHGIKIYEEPPSFLLKKVIQEKIGEINFCLEDDDGHVSV